MRMIDADALDSKIESHYRHKKIDRYDHDLLGHYLDVEMAPTIDAEPVRRGVWVPIDDEPHEDFECSACGYVSTAAFDCGGITPNAFPYCPMCGAKMDGDGDAR